MPRTRTGSSIKDPKLYERLRVQGNSNEKAARIANAAAVDVARRSAVAERNNQVTAVETLAPVSSMPPGGAINEQQG